MSQSRVEFDLDFCFVLFCGFFLTRNGGDEPKQHCCCCRWREKEEEKRKDRKKRGRFFLKNKSESAVAAHPLLRCYCSTVRNPSTINHQSTPPIWICNTNRALYLYRVNKKGEKRRRKERKKGAKEGKQ